MAKRKSLSKKTRFEVFKRDGFVCGYCGSTPPSVVLEVDHILAVANGGDNSIDNLLTSCFDCNRGKGANSLNVISPSIAEKAKILKEKESQLKEFSKLQSSIKRRVTKSINKIENVMQLYFENKVFSDTFRISVKRFLSRFSQQDLMDIMETACIKMNNAESALKYFCGICWAKIKGTYKYE